MNLPKTGIKNLPIYLNQVDEVINRSNSKHIDGVNRLLETPGKRWRPSIVLTIACINGKTIDERVINAAAAVELVHIASLVHDDIIDKADFRRGIATINSREGLESGIIAGDYLLAKGCSLASSVSSETGNIVADTIAELCEGEALELKDRNNLERTEESLLAAIRGKTSSIFIAACKLGGIVSGLSKSDVNSLSEFAENFGIAYQIIDDVNDFTAAESVSGKKAGNDISEGNYTLPVILSLKGPSGDQLRKLLIHGSAATPEIIQILEKDKSLEISRKEASKYKQFSEKALKKLSNKELELNLQKFIDSF